MKILFLTTDFPPHGGGVASLSLEQAVRLAQLGNEVRVETVDFGPLPSICQTTDNLTVHQNHIKAGPVKRLLPLWRIVRDSSKHFEPDVYYASTHRGFGLPMAVHARTAGKPYSIYFHGTEILTELTSLPRRKLLAWIIRHANVLFSNSYNTRKLLQDFFPYRLPHVEVVYPGIDHSRFDDPGAKSRGKTLREKLLSEADLPADTVVLLSVSRLSRQKGIDVTLKALAQLQQYGGPLPHWLYVVAGSGPDENEFRTMTQQLGLAGRVIFTGAIPYLETAPLYYAADIYVQPSQPHGMFLESFGISFVEAQYCGLPCIATRFGGIPESVKDGETGILVPPGDINELVQALGTLIRDRERRSSMASRAREHARAFSWDTHTRKLEQTLTDYCIPPRAGMQK